MDILSVLQLLGGVGLFLYGMSLMGSSLEKLAGSGLERILEKLTTSKRKGVGYIKGWGLGAGVTAIIQSSAATTITGGRDYPGNIRASNGYWLFRKYRTTVYFSG